MGMCTSRTPEQSEEQGGVVHSIPLSACTQWSYVRAWVHAIWLSILKEIEEGCTNFPYLVMTQCASFMHAHESPGGWVRRKEASVELRADPQYFYLTVVIQSKIEWSI